MEYDGKTVPKPEDKTRRKDLVKQILNRHSELELIRKNYEDLWYDIVQLCNYRRDDYLQTDTKGRKRGKQSWDGTANSALNIWVDGMQGFMVSPSLVWARAMISELWDVDEVRAYLQEYDRSMLNGFRRSNFYSMIPEAFRDAGSIGTATVFTEMDFTEMKSVHTAVHPGQIWIAENRYGNVDTVHRKYKMTARQIIQKFGQNNEGIGKTVKDAAEKQPQTEFEILHCVYPNEDYLPGKLVSSRKAFRSIYILLGGKGTMQGQNVNSFAVNDSDIIRESGFTQMPYTVWRFRKNSDEIYGYSPAADAIIEMETLNTLAKTKIQAAQLSVEPAYNVPSEMRDNVKILPKGMNFYKDPKRIVSPVLSGINYPVGIEEAERLERLIEDKFRVQFFLLLKGAEREMTATEILERQSEQAALMGPQVDRMIGEFLSPLYEMVADIEERAGNLPDPPDSLIEYVQIMARQGKVAKIDPEFVGPLAQAQKRLFESQPIINTINAVGPLMAIKPDVIDKFDIDGMAEDIAESYACPQKRIRTDQQVAEIRAQRAQQQEQEKQEAMALEAAKTVPKLSKPIEAGSPLDLVGSALT